MATPTFNSPLPVRVINTENIRRTPIQEVLKNGYQSLIQNPKPNVSAIPAGGSYLLDIPL